VRHDTVRFASLLARRPRAEPRLPLTLPSSERWLLKVLVRDGRFVLGLYRRHMKVIGYLGALDRLFGVPLTTRNWNTITAIGDVLTRDAASSPPGPVRRARIGSVREGAVPLPDRDWRP
jgi:hypothetical protein